MLDFDENYYSKYDNISEFDTGHVNSMFHLDILNMAFQI